jgi:hypothetical protein
MSAMGSSVLEVQEAIIDMLNDGMKIVDIDEQIVSQYGSMFRGMVDQVIREEY